MSIPEIQLQGGEGYLNPNILKNVSSTDSTSSVVSQVRDFIEKL